MTQFKEFPNKQKNPENPQIWDVAPGDVLAAKSEVCIVDVRRPDEYDGPLGHIAGSQHIVLDTLPHEIESLPTDKTIVFVCHAGGRSARATQFAAAHGFTHVYNMQGGMALWHQLHLPVEGQS